MNLGLDGKTALIFGGSRGIGAATARVLAGEGVKVAITGRTAPEALAKEVGGMAFAADLTQFGAAEAAFASTVETFGRVDIVVVSVGAAQGGLFWELDDKVWADAMELKFMGLVRALRACAPALKAQGSGRIVAVVGNLAKQPGKRLLPGSAANAACLALVRGAAEELSPYGVQVNAVNPGPTRTDRWSTLIGNLAKAQDRPYEEIEAEQLAGMPGGRIAEADEIARMIAVLASDMADHMSGTSITVDGGMTKGI